MRDPNLLHLKLNFKVMTIFIGLMLAWPWPLILWPHLNKDHLLVMIDISAKFKDWRFKHLSVINQTRFSWKCDIDLWPDDLSSILVIS